LWTGEKDSLGFERERDVLASGLLIDLFKMHVGGENNLLFSTWFYPHDSNVGVGAYLVRVHHFESKRCGW
jgi:hypothetical protein